MVTSRDSSTPTTTSSPSEADVLRTLHAGDFPCWSDEPLASVLAERLSVAPRAVRPILEGFDIRLDMAGPQLGKLDETWLFRAPSASTPLDERLAGIEGILAWTQLEEAYVLVRTLSQDAVERERRLRALHKAMSQRPLQQLHRAHPPAPKRKLSRADWALLSAMRKKPWAPLDALAAEAGAPLRVAKDRVPKLVADRIATLEAAPRVGPLACAIVRLAPSSTAAAWQALAAIGGALVRAHVPDAAEASLVDAELWAPLEAWPAMRAQALDVPGVANIEVLAATRAWYDAAGIEAHVKRAFSDASA